MIVVINKYTDRIPDGFIGFDVMRPNILGNPFKGDREETVPRFRKYLKQELDKMDSVVRLELYRLANFVKEGNKLALVCCCKPKLCHSEVIKSCIEWLVTTY